MLAEFDRVLVTGPQRSGTKLTALLVADAIGYRYIPHGWMNPVTEGLDVFRNAKEIVLHNPSYVAFAQEVSGPSTAIIFVWRELSEIHDSERRHGWTQHEYELELLGCESGDPATVKQDMWAKDLHRLENTWRVDYRGLESHPRFCNNRDGWEINQVDNEGTIVCPSAS
jgi:hypothetical protein